MSSIGRGHLHCTVKGCNKIRPYWSDMCKTHRDSEAMNEQNETHTMTDDELANAYYAAMREGREADAAKFANEAARRGMIL